MNYTEHKSKLTAAMITYSIIFVTYNIALFAISGFAGHGAEFWISYVFMLAAFVVVWFSGYKLRYQELQPKDWLLGYPILWHCAVHIGAEFVCSTVFMLLDKLDIPWGIVLAVQLILLAVHMVFVISCFVTKEIIDETQVKVKSATTFMKMLQADVEILAEKAADPETRQAFGKLAEEVKYSDHMSNEYLADIEESISQQVHAAGSFLDEQNTAAALECCRKAEQLLAERNKKCKLLK